MSLISGSYSRTCGGGGAPDCREVIVENCLYEVVLLEAPNLALVARTRGARRVCDWRAGSRSFLDAVRTLRLRVDMMEREVIERRGDGKNTKKESGEIIGALQWLQMLFCAFVTFLPSFNSRNLGYLRHGKLTGDGLEENVIWVFKHWTNPIIRGWDICGAISEYLRI